MQFIQIGNLEVSRFILGGNPFSGFSHQGIERDGKMLDYYSTENIKKDFKKAEELGISTNIARADHHIVRIMREYWNEGGKLQWIAQTCPELGAVERGVESAIRGGAKACFIHGGVMDNYLVNGKLDLIPSAIKMIKDAGMPAGVAGHRPEVFAWAEENLDTDFYMCCYYNPSSRDEEAGHRSEVKEWFLDKDRDKMFKTIQGLSKPAIHYKIMGAGRNDPEEAIKKATAAMRPGDAVCVGIFSGDDPQILEKDVRLFERYTKA